MTGASGEPTLCIETGECVGVGANEEPPLKLNSPLDLMGLVLEDVAT